MHQHTLIELYSLFVLGTVMHVLKRLNAAKLPNSQYLRTYWRALVVRGFLSFVIFQVWQANPGAIAKYDPTGILSWFLGALPNTHLVAPIFGYFIDSALDGVASKIPWLGKEIPPLPNNNTPPQTSALGAKP